jgi:hypothetical protein
LHPFFICLVKVRGWIRPAHHHEQSRMIEGWSECADSNRGPQRPERCALPTALHPDISIFNF